MQRQSNPIPNEYANAGGPGCSSELAVFKENGPYEINSDGEVRERKYAWDVEVCVSLAQISRFEPAVRLSSNTHPQSCMLQGNNAQNFKLMSIRSNISCYCRPT